MIIAVHALEPFDMSSGKALEAAKFSRKIPLSDRCPIMVIIVSASNPPPYCCAFVPASPDQGHDRPCRRDVGRVFLAGVRRDSPSRRRILSCYRSGSGRGVVVELGQRGAH